MLTLRNVVTELPITSSPDTRDCKRSPVSGFGQLQGERAGLPSSPLHWETPSNSIITSDVSILHLQLQNETTNGFVSSSRGKDLPPLQLCDPKLPKALNKVFCNHANTSLNTQFINHSDEKHPINPNLHTESSMKNNKRELLNNSRSCLLIAMRQETGRGKIIGIPGCPTQRTQI